jgi:hypothetical protein
MPARISGWRLAGLALLSKWWNFNLLLLCLGNIRTKAIMRLLHCPWTLSHSRQIPLQRDQKQRPRPRLWKDIRRRRELNAESQCRAQRKPGRWPFFPRVLWVARAWNENDSLPIPSILPTAHRDTDERTGYWRSLKGARCRLGILRSDQHPPQQGSLEKNRSWWSRKSGPSSGGKESFTGFYDSFHLW